MRAMSGFGGRKVRGRHSASSSRRPRRRWALLGVGILAWGGLVVGLTGSTDPVPAAQSSDASEAAVPVSSIPALSAGAPAGARTLPATPVQAAQPEPATPEAVGGLAANGIPTVALNAYRVAAARLGGAKPQCGIDWSLLAGIGRVESNHGRFGGATLNADGTSTPEIRGPALDGGQFAYIGDSDDGRFDHDTTYDRAVGAMQFIPTTWRSYAIDADGNGTTDPFDIDDAALGAANYLCVAGGDLRTESGLRRAVLAYNHSDAYVDQVLALARAYAAGIPVDGLPLSGNTSGPVPPPTGFYRAPAAPGPAIGAADRTPASGDTVGATPAQSSAQPASPAGPPPDQGSPAEPPPSRSEPAPAPPQQAGSPAPPPATTADPAPAPAPVPVPVPAPAPLPTVPLPSAVGSSAPELLEGVTCNVLGNLVPDLPDLPECPRG